MKICRFCGQQVEVCFHRNFNVFCSPEHADAFDGIHPTESPFDKELDAHIESLAEEDYPIHWCEADGASNGGGTP